MQAEHYRYLEERNLNTKKFSYDLRGHMMVLLNRRLIRIAVMDDEKN